ncbi:MAG: DUF899 domain-containing protein [Phenylobacterium sp.]|nr:MAG: DUF899 domain-containing protein [Phenylobacterium sp.]
MADGALPSATTLAKANGVRFPNESPAYRDARDALLAEEIELRRHIERVAAQRRALPPGGEVRGDYRFEGEAGPMSFAELFGEKDTLILYSYMFGPKRERPCPMCTSMLDGWEGEIPSLQKRAAVAVVARSPIGKLLAWKRQRGWKYMPLVADLNDTFSRDYHAVAPDGGDDAALHVFTRKDGVIRHFWSAEMGGSTADPGQDPRGAPDLAPLWTVLDATPEGRGADFYPTLDD